MISVFLVNWEVMGLGTLNQDLRAVRASMMHMCPDHRTSELSTFF